MKILALLVLTFSFFSCLDKENGQPPIIGTWELQTGMVIQKMDTVVTDYTKEQRLIKMINETHFSFLRHDLNKGKDSSSVFAAGGGAYSFDGKTYKEELEFCSGRSWEGKKFSFNVIIKNDTLTQRGIEKIEELGIEQTIVETYFRVKK